METKQLDDRITQRVAEILVERGLIQAADPPEPALPVVEVFDATTPENCRHRYVATPVGLWCVSEGGTMGRSAFERDQLTDETPLTANPPSRELMGKLEVALSTLRGWLVASNGIDDEQALWVDRLLSAARRHTDPPQQADPELATTLRQLAHALHRPETAEEVRNELISLAQRLEPQS